MYSLTPRASYEGGGLTHRTDVVIQDECQVCRRAVLHTDPARGGRRCIPQGMAATFVLDLSGRICVLPSVGSNQEGVRTQAA